MVISFTAAKRKKRTKKFPHHDDGKVYKLTKLDDFFTPEELSRDVFGFLTAISDTEVEGFFAVFDLGNAIRATEVYSKEILEEMVIPDVLKSYPGAFYKIFPES
jgi:hypothetical protein